MNNNLIRTFLLKINSDLFDIDDAVNTGYYFFKCDVPELFKKDMDDIHKYVICLEDRRFLKHYGVDYIAICREIVKYFFYIIRLKKYKIIGGASTIDMQLVRTITGYKERTVCRKLYEMLLAHLINIKYDKRKIINTYFRYAFFGSNIYGIYDFLKGKKLSDISKEEKSIMAACLQKPEPINPTDIWYNKVHTRAFYARKVYNKLFNS